MNDQKLATEAKSMVDELNDLIFKMSQQGLVSRLDVQSQNIFVSGMPTVIPTLTIEVAKPL
ncbi:hypothetical protein [Brucella intermedia]|uniref:hypothetical protein n=1 Tax=Brucella intermedia TaxID=94625 RepID=UPI00165D1FA6|nr:hypothetical protein [Brucella intermedia]QNQ40587.1 hypothetical protein IAR37_01765 [Brucella intermedia]